MTQPWWRDGLRFSCTQCGNCCTGGEGAVWYSPAEGAALAKLLGLSQDDFEKRHTRQIGQRRSLNETPTSFGLDCVFLDRTTMPGKAICGVYEARPLQCRTWPFWPENIETPAAWEKTRRRTPCPGMGQGNLVPADQIRIIRDRECVENSDAPW